MYIEVALLGEAASTPRVITQEVATSINTVVLDLHMRFQVTVGCTDLVTLVAGGWMYDLGMLLHLDVCRKADGSLESIWIQTWIDLGDLWRAYLAPKAITTVLAILVGGQMGRRLEAGTTDSRGGGIDNIADKGLFLKMDQFDMPVQSFLLSKFLIAWQKASALVLLFSCFVDLLMKFETLIGVEGLAAVFEVANIVTHVFVLGLDMVLEVALS